MKIIFKKPIPNELLFDLLEKVCLKTRNYYTFRVDSYRKVLEYSYHEPFLKTLIDEYYHESKRFYAERELNYHMFTTVIKQICRFSDIVIEQKIKYYESKQETVFFIYFL